MINDLSMSEMLREFWWRLSWVALLVDMKWILNPVKFLEDPSGNGSGVQWDELVTMGLTMSILISAK